MRIIKQVGNYGEVFERNVGQGSPLKIDARPERAVDQGRHAVRAADPLTRSRAAACARRRGAPRSAAARGKCRLTFRGRSPARVAFYNDPKVRSIAYQVALCAVVVLLVYGAASNAIDNLRARISPPASASGTTPPASTSARR